MLNFYKLVLLISDVVLVNCALLLTLILRFDLGIPSQYVKLYTAQWVVLMLIHLTVNMGFRLYRCLLRYVTAREVLYIGGATFVSCSLFYTYGHLIDHPFPNSVYVGYTCILLLLMLLSRLSYNLVNYILTKFSKTYLSLKNHMNKVHKTLRLM